MEGASLKSGSQAGRLRLYCYGYRFYHPDRGRFVNRDPMGEAGGVNLYAFVFNDPNSLFDLLGLTGCESDNWSKADCYKLFQRIVNAKLSRAAYDGKAPAGWTLGETWADSKSGFKAREFLSDAGERVIAFAGTEAEWGDIRADAQQAVGQAYTPQYEFAARIGNRNRGTVDAFVGHSLGGGLAHVAGGVSLIENVTFNAAGLHSNTISYYQESSRWGTPTNIHTANDILTIFQSHQKFPNTTGDNVMIPNSRERGFFETQVGFNGRMHGINEVIGSLQQQYYKYCK